MRVFAYRNLNRKGVVWSVRGVITGLVITRTPEAFFRNVRLKVSSKGRERTLRLQQRNVHAGVEGDWIDSLPDGLEWVKATYNPYKHTSFVLEDGTGIEYTPYAKLTQLGLFVVKSIEPTLYEQRIIEVMGLFLKKRPDILQVRMIDSDYHPMFQDWVADNIKREYNYMTADAVIQATIDLVESGEINGTSSY